MTSEKDGKAVPGDLAECYLKDIAAALRKETKKNKYTRAFYSAFPDYTENYPFQRPYYGAHAEALKLAADILETVAMGRDDFSKLMDRRAESMQRNHAVQAVLHERMQAWREGKPISREEAYRRADDARGENTSKRYFLDWEKKYGRVPDLPTKQRKG